MIWMLDIEDLSVGKAAEQKEKIGEMIRQRDRILFTFDSFLHVTPSQE